MKRVKEEMSDKKVSIIVPIYNAENYLEKCLESLLFQSYKNLEILLIDDGSPDKCPQICDEYAKKDSRVRVVHQKNSGASKARENGLKIAQGEYVSFVDPDDWLEISAMEELMEAAEMFAADIVIFDWQAFFDGGRILVNSQNLSNDMSMEEIRNAFLMDQCPNFMCNKLFKKALFDNLVFPGRMIYEDLYINAEIFCRCKKAYYIAKPFYCYRIHASYANTTGKIRQKHGLFLAWQEHERVCEAYKLEKPLPYCRLRAQQAVIGLLTLNTAKPELDTESIRQARAYLEKSEEHPAERLSFKFKFEWWSLLHAPFIAKLSGKLSLWADERKRQRKFKL